MSSFTSCDITNFFCKIGKVRLIVFQKLATSVMLKNINGMMNFHISGCLKAFL